MKTNGLLIFIIVFAGCGTWYLLSGVDVKEVAIKNTEHSYSEALNVYDVLLTETVRAGVVDYSAMQKRLTELDAYLAVLAKTDPASLSKNEALAFWINAYNAFTLHMMLQHIPNIGSIKDINNRWDVDIFTVSGEKYSLNHIENEILRKEFSDPRIHFAIVCASMSCPDLRSGAFRAGVLQSQLDEQMISFLNNPMKGLKSNGPKRLLVSKIFSWFAGDFEKASGSVQVFIKNNAPPELLSDLTGAPEDWELDYFEYDWGINDHQFRKSP